MRTGPADQRPYIMTGHAGNGTSGSGPGYTWVRNGIAGWYTVRFDRPFRGSPAVTMSTETGTASYAAQSPNDGRSFDVRVWNNAGTLVDNISVAWVASGVLA